MDESVVPPCVGSVCNGVGSSDGSGGAGLDGKSNSSAATFLVEKRL
ncbi:MAG: hypothetical protein ABFS18_09900 [Thermodesulfobacteriota bacterium]